MRAFQSYSRDQVQASGYLVKLTNDITFFRNNTTVLPVYPGFNRKSNFIKSNRVDLFATDPTRWSSTTCKTHPFAMYHGALLLLLNKSSILEQ